MTTKSSIQSIKSRLPRNHSVNSTITNDNDIKSRRIHANKSLSIPNTSLHKLTANSFSNHLKKRTAQLNKFFHSKLKSNHSNEHTNELQSNEQSISTSVISHITVLSEEMNNLPRNDNGEAKLDNQSKLPLNHRATLTLGSSTTESMPFDRYSNLAPSSHSEEDENQLEHNRVLFVIDADVDESDNSNNKIIKRSRRFQKTQKTNISSSQQKYGNNSTTDDRQESSSNEDESKEAKSILNGRNERKIKSSLVRKLDCLTTTTTDDDTTKNQLNSLSSIPTKATSINQPSIRKINRFQVKSIHNSQQQQILLENLALAKSSNDEDYSVPNLLLKQFIIGEKSTNTSSMDIESPTSNTDHAIGNTVSMLTIVENKPNHVHFHSTVNEKHESTNDEEKLPSQTTTILPAIAPPSSTAFAQGVDDEEEEAVGKSPDNRFIKYDKEIGRGAFKTVYRGLDTETSVAIAWCELQDFAHFNKHERARFKEEAEMLKKLQHPNIVRLYDFWEETNPRTNKKVIILVTELMTSGSLKRYIRKFKGQKEEKRIHVMKKWCRQILKGLAYLHSRKPPVIHRDLKCDNVFISSTNGCVKIGDLGLATFKTQTFAKSMRGTMEFMAPEMFDEKYDELVDIYSFGLCMLEMVTGEYPYIECKAPTAVIKRVTAGLKPDCYYKVENEDVREVVNCCIRKNKEERLSVHELLQHSFFLDNNGLRIDFVRDPANDSQIMITNNSIDLKLKIIDKKKRQILWSEHEAIRFRYNLTTDKPEQIADELIEKKYILNEDKKFVVQSMKDRVRAYQYEQIDRKAGVFGRDGKPFIHSTAFVGQQQQVLSSQPLIPPLLVPVQISNAPSIIPTPSITQQSLIDVQQQQQQQIVKPLPETPQYISIATTEPIPTAQSSELGLSLLNSPGSLERLEAALKKTFNKTGTLQDTSTTTTATTTIINHINDPKNPSINQNDSSTSRLTNESTVTDQQQLNESGGSKTDDLIMDILQRSISSMLPTQSQLTTMSTSHQSQMASNPSLLTQTSRNASPLTVPSSHYLITATIPSDTLKQTIPSSTAPITENNHTSVSSLHTNEAPLSSTVPDVSSNTQAPMSSSLIQLDVLLKNTFKHSIKTTGTAHNSDTEVVNTNVPSVSLTVNNENSTKMTKTESYLIGKSDKNKQNPNPNVSLTTYSQPNTLLVASSKPIEQTKLQPMASQILTGVNQIISSERNTGDLVSSPKMTYDKSSCNDETIMTPLSSNLFEIKLMITDLCKTLLNRMDTIEMKIDEHKNHTIQINNLLTKTILPSLIDLTAIIHEIPNLDPHIRAKLEYILTTIQQQKPIEMKSSLDI